MPLPKTHSRLLRTTHHLDTVVAILIGLGLAAACGLRVFLPLLVLSVSAQLGVTDLGESWAWAGSWPAITALGVAAAIEVGAYWVPWLDHGLDLIAGPCAVVAGTLAGMSPGGAGVLGAMAASASYIAAPAAVRMMLPKANPSIYLTGAIAVTFPFNLVIGIPIYLELARLLGPR